MQHLRDFAALMFDRRVSWASKLFFVIVAGAYVVLPIDLIPDIFLPFGIVDDGGLVLLAMSAFTRHARGQIERHTPVSSVEDNDIIVSDAKTSVVASAADEDDIVIPQASTDYPKAGKQYPHTHHTARGSGNNAGCLALLALLIFSPFAGVAIIILSGSAALSGLFSSVINIFDPPPTANIVSSRTIVHSLQGLGQLVTVSSEVAKAGIQVSVNEGFLNAGYYSASHMAVGVVEAGIDITAADRDDVSYDAAANTYTLRLPTPNITSCRIEHIDQYGGSLTLLPVDWDVIRQLAQHDAIRQFTQDMIERGILERAQEEASLRVGNFISALTGGQAHIEYKETDAPPKPPPSCQPDPPRGWEKDEDGAWRRAN